MSGARRSRPWRSRWASGATFLGLMVAAVAVTWWVSTPEQRDGYRALIGRGDAPVQGRADEQRAPDAPAPPESAQASGPQAPVVPERGRHSTREGAGAAACRPPTRDTGEVDRDPVFQWHDAQGRPVFGDEPPPGTLAEDLTALVGRDEQFARVTVEDRGSRFAARLESALREDVERIGRFLRASLALPVRQIDLNVTIYGSLREFRASSDRQRLGQGLAGLYRHGGNRIALAEQQDFDSTRRVGRHEASHAVLAGMYGPTPIWLNEGLAEAMEMLQPTGPSRTLAVNQRYAERLREERPAELPALLEHDYDSWHAQGSDLRYAHAWALVHELMSHGAGRALIRAVLDAQGEAPCAELDSIGIVNEVYPGGVGALERRWQERMRNGRWQPLSF